MNMKKKTKLLAMCMVASLSVGTPVITWASDTETTEQKSGESDSISISEKGAETSIYEDKKVTIKMDSAEYTLDASDIILNMSIKNSYPNILTLKVQDAKVDDTTVAFQWDSNDYKAGTSFSSAWYIMLETLQEVNNTDFKQLSFTMVGTLNDGTELLKKEITIAREAFKSVMDEDDEETSDSESTDSNNATSEATEEKSDAKSDSNKDSSDGIEERLSALEEKQASQNESDKETVQEETTPAADAEEEKAKATEDEDKSNENIQKTLIPDQYIEKEEVFGDDGKLSFTYQYEYDDEYRLIEKQCVYPDGTVNNDEKYTYDKDGNNIRIDHEDNKDSSYSYYTIHKYKGDDLIESTTYNVADDSVKYTMSYSYDDKNRLCQEKFENIEYDNQATTNYFYDDNGNIIYSERDNERYEDYTYDADGNLISQTRNDGTRTEWKYENNIKIEETFYHKGDFLYTSKLEYASTSPSAAVINDIEIIKVVQQALNDMGYDCGIPDGIVGDGTKNAVKSYMENNGKASKGEITEELVGMLNVNDEIKSAKELSRYRTDISYEMLMRNPVDYINTPVKFSGSVVQVINEGGGNNIRLAINSDSSQTIWCSYSRLDMSGNLMEGDQVTVYGIAMGTEDYIAISGEKITLPTITCERMDTSFGTFEKFPGF